jgi:hypothetical protein
MWQNEENNLPRISKQNVRPTALYDVPSRYTRIFILPVLYRTHLEPAGLQKLGKLKEPEV